MKLRSIAALLLSATTAFAASDDKKDEKAWDVSSPPGEKRDVAIDTHSGTWMSVDVSPDGKRVTFDMLGDIYDLQIEGGEARALASGMAWDMQPRYSPDGKLIAFTSDRAGGDNLWIMDANGGNARQISKESFRLLNNPVWHPSGRYVAGRKHFTTRRSLGTGEIWLYSLDGGEGVQLVKRPSEEFQKELGEPAFSPDGKYLYFSQNITPGPVFQYAQDINGPVFAIRRYEVATGETDDAVSEPGGAARPTPSPDGRWLAFVHRVRTPQAFETALFVKDLVSGQERSLYMDLDRDMQETWAINGLYPNMDWTPDSKSVVVWAGGGIKRIDVASGAVSDIPFHVKDARMTIVPPRFDVNVAPDEVQSRMARFASVSPDGKQVVFESFGHLWLRSVAAGAARRLTRDDAAAFELFPAWSHDGKRIVFIRWTDAGLGEVHVVGAGGGASRAVSKQPGHYMHPRFSPDGKSIVVERSTDGRLTSPLWSADPGIYRLAVDSGAAVRLTEDGRDPHFVGTDGRIYFTADKDGAKESEPAHELVSVDANGQDRHVHARSNYATNMEVSPSGQWLAFRENFHIYVVPMPPGGQVDLSLQTKAVPLRRASDIGGEYINWIDGDTLSWTLGASLYRAEMAELFATGTKAEETHGKGVADLEHDARGGQAARRRGAHRRAHRHDERRAAGDRERHDRRSRQSYRRRRRERLGGNSGRRAATGSRGPHRHARHHRHACARPAGRQRHRAAAELVDARASRARRDDGARPVEQRDRDLRRVGVSAGRPDPRAAHLLDRRRRLRRALRRASRASTTSTTRAITSSGSRRRVRSRSRTTTSRGASSGRWS